MNLYQTGKALRNAGALSGFDITIEGALTKLFHLMGKYEDNAEVKMYVEQNLRGEISLKN